MRIEMRQATDMGHFSSGWRPRRPGSLMLAVAALAAVTAGQLRAEPELGSRIDTNRGAVGEVEDEDVRAARRVMIAYGRCVARNRMRLAQAILAEPIFGEQQYALIRRRFGGSDGCMGSSGAELRFSPMLLVGAMAEWFILERYEEADLGAVAALDDARVREVGLTPRSGYEDVALCVVRHDPVAARDLVRSRPAGDAERAAIARLVPHLGTCLPAGQEYRFNRGAVRALVAPASTASSR